MHQLALGIKLRDSSRFSTYFAGSNLATVDTLRKLCPHRHAPVIWLCGNPGTGKTHLLQAICAAAGERQETAAFFHLQQLQSIGPDLLEGCGELSWVCLDDFDEVAALPLWQRAVFSLYCELEQFGGRLLIGARCVPTALKIELRDLASRLNASVLCRLHSLNDEEQAHALQLRAAQRGMDLPEETATYLQRRVPRNLAWLCDFLDALDEASLSAQRRLTIPFVRDVLRLRGLGADESEKA